MSKEQQPQQEREQETKQEREQVREQETLSAWDLAFQDVAFSTVAESDSRTASEEHTGSDSTDSDSTDSAAIAEDKTTPQTQDQQDHIEVETNENTEENVASETIEATKSAEATEPAESTESTETSETVNASASTADHGIGGEIDNELSDEIEEDLNISLKDPLLSLQSYPTLALQNVTVIDSKTKLTALDHVNLDFYARKSHSVLVNSDAQRAALMSVIAAFTAPSEGTVSFKSQPLVELLKHDWRGHFLGMMTQRFALLSGKTARENLIYVMRASGRNFLKALHLVADDVLREVGFDLKRNDIPVRDLHAAERQLVSLAKALSCEPAVLVADEPTLQLGEDNSKTVLSQVLAVADHRDCAVIIITSDPEVAKQAEIQYKLD